AGAVAERRHPRDARECGPPRRKLGPQPLERLIQVDQPAEVLDLQPERLEDGRVPAPGPLVEEPGPRRHRDARAQLAEETKAEILPERHPAPRAAKRRGVTATEPPEPCRKIRRVETAPDARVVRLLVDADAQLLDRVDTPRVRPGIQGGRRTVVRPEAEHSVPEGAGRDRRHAGRARAQSPEQRL